jgi:hypothetical protein
MKYFYTYTKLLFLALIATMTMTSCDEDAALAYDLEGVWQGTITGNYYYDRYHVTTNDYDTEIMFHQISWEKGGNGYEIDRRYGSRTYTKTYFDWRVRDGKIYLEYDDGYRVIVRDFETYTMGGRMRFRGYFENFDTGEDMASFSLIKVDAPNSYYDRNNYYYAPQKNVPKDSLANDSIQ